MTSCGDDVQSSSLWFYPDSLIISYLNLFNHKSEWIVSYILPKGYDYPLPYSLTL